MEGYGGGGRQKRLPWHVVQRMKQRMRQAPLIQKANDERHHAEAREADDLLKKAMRDVRHHETTHQSTHQGGSLGGDNEYSAYDQKKDHAKTLRQRISSLFLNI